MNRPYHVLSVVHSLSFGGDESRLLSMIQSVDPDRFRFSVLLLPYRLDSDRVGGTMRPAMEAAGIHVHQLENPSSPSWLPRPAGAFIGLIRKIRAVARLAREWEVDLVDARLDGGMIIGVPAAAIARKLSVSTTYYADPWTKYPFWRLVRAGIMNLTHAVITDSAARQAELKRWIWNRSGSTWCIPNGIPVPAATRSAAMVREELDLPRDPRVKIIAQIAGLVPYKGQTVLLEAARKVLETEPCAFFLLVGYCRGEKQYEQQLFDRARALGISERTRIFGYPGQIGDIWQIVDIHTHPSLWDSLPNAILEGMALGKPCVVTSVGGIPEAVENEKTGLVIPPNDPDALARALVRLLRNPNQASSLGAAAKLRYESRYRPAEMARALETCFESVLNHRDTVSTRPTSLRVGHKTDGRS